MALQWGTNPATWYLLFPLFVIVLTAVVWLVVRLRVSTRAKVAACFLSVFALIGFTASLLVVYYHVNEAFANSFRFYAYGTLAPTAGDPFDDQGIDQQVVMLRGVGHRDGALTALKHPTPGYPTLVYLFAPGKMITANLQGDTLTYFGDKGQAVVATSLWQALTRDPRELVVLPSE